MAIFRRNTPTNFAPVARYIFQCDNRLKLCSSVPPPLSTIVNTLVVEFFQWNRKKIPSRVLKWPKSGVKFLGGVKNFGWGSTWPPPWNFSGYAPDLQRNDWQVGIIVDVFPSDDGVVRSCKVRTKSGTYIRPVCELVRLCKEGPGVFWPKNGPENSIWSSELLLKYSSSVSLPGL